MTHVVPKEAIAESFSASAATYDRWARPQSLIAEKLASYLPKEIHDGPILDVGCGTGMLTEHLEELYSKNRILGIDIAPGMVSSCDKRWTSNGNLRFEVADGESFDADGTLFSLVASSCSIQWFADPAKGVRDLCKVVCPGGTIALAVPVTGSLFEVAECHKAVAGHGLPGPEFRTADSYLEALVEGGAEIAQSHCETVELFYYDPLDVLRSFKGIGATPTLANRKPLSYGQMTRLIEIYEERFGRAGGQVPVTYQILFVVAEKQT